MTHNGLRLQVCTLTLVALTIFGLLLIGGRHDHIIREYAYPLNGITPTETLKPGHRICEAPVEANGEFGQLVFWSSGADSRASVSVHRGTTPNAPTVAIGLLESGTTAGENVVTLTQPVTRSANLSVCVRSLHDVVTLYGGQSQYLSNFTGPPYGAPVIAGSHPDLTLWMQAWSAQPHGIWRSLSLAFRRMSLFRLSWVGAWTFWVLLVGVFAGFPLLVVAVWLALKAEHAHDDEIPLE